MYSHFDNAQIKIMSAFVSKKAIKITKCGFDELFSKIFWSITFLTNGFYIGTKQPKVNQSPQQWRGR